MPEPFLIAHKVRGEPAFDIAERMRCPICQAYEYVEGQAVAESNSGCEECDSLGFWWIISTFGHRAHPYESWPLHEITNFTTLITFPEDWPDLFSINDKKHVALNLDEYGGIISQKDKEAGRNLLATLGLLREAPKAEPIKRRI